MLRLTALFLLGLGAVGFVLFDPLGGGSREPLPDLGGAASVASEKTEAQKSEAAKHAPVVVEKQGEPESVAPAADELRGRVTDRGAIALGHATVEILLYTPPGERSFALVRRFKQEVEVDDDGRWSLSVPGGGWFKVTAEAKGFAPATKERVQPGEEVLLELEMGAILAGQAVNESGRPVVGAKIHARFKTAAVTRDAVTDAQGRFRLEDLPAGLVTLNARHSGYVDRTDLSEELEVGGTHEMRIEFDLGKRIKGRVLSAAEGLPLEKARIRSGSKEATSDGQGFFTLVGLPSKKIDIEVYADGYIRHNRKVNLAGSRKEAEVEVQLDQGAEIFGVVRTDAGDPVEGAEMALFESWGSSWMWEHWQTRHLRPKTNEFGEFSMRGIPVSHAKYAMKATKEGFPPGFARDLKIKRKDDRLYAEVVLRPGTAVSGWVHSDEGGPVEGARVQLRKQDAWGSSIKSLIVGSAADGSFRFEDVSEGRYWLSVEARGYSTAYKSNIQVRGSSEVTGVEIKLKKGKPVKGIVTDKQGIPLAGALVQVGSNGGRGKAVSDVEGRFTVPSVPEGDLWANATLDGYGRWSKRKIQLDGEGLIRIELSPQPTLRGVVIDRETKEPVTSFRIVLSKEDERRRGRRKVQYSRTIRHPKGEFRVQAPKGRYRLEVTASGYVLWKKEPVVYEEDKVEETLSVELQGGGAIEGYAYGSDGQPLRGVTVYHKAPEEDFYTRRGSTEHDGYYFLGDLAMGDHDVVFRRYRHPLKIENGIRVFRRDPVRLDATMETVATLVLRSDVEMKPHKPSPDPRIERRNRRSRSRRHRANFTLKSLDRTPTSMDGKGWDRVRGRRYQLGYQRRLRINPGSSTTLRDLLPGEYLLQASVRGRQKYEEVFRIDFGSRLDIRVEFPLKGAPRVH